MNWFLNLLYRISATAQFVALLIVLVFLQNPLELLEKYELLANGPWQTIVYQTVCRSPEWSFSQYCSLLEDFHNSPDDHFVRSALIEYRWKANVTFTMTEELTKIKVIGGIPKSGRPREIIIQEACSNYGLVVFQEQMHLPDEHGNFIHCFARCGSGYKTQRLPKCEIDVSGRDEKDWSCDCEFLVQQLWHWVDYSVNSK